jgi:polysaccharide export outer membrane protein
MAASPASGQQIGQSLGLAPATPIQSGEMRAGISASNSNLGGAMPVTAVPEDFSKIRLAPGFLLDCKVLGEADLSGSLRVSESGDVEMPEAGKIHVAGDTLLEAQNKIMELLRVAEILKEPQVQLNIVQYAPEIVAVLGEVQSPGRLQLLAPHSLLDVISFAGGETPLAGPEIQVRRKDDQGQTTTTSYHYGRNSNGDSIAGVPIKSGDVVIVPRAGIVYVLGDVNRPGGYLMQEDGKLNVAQALSLAAGTDIQARTSRIRILRRKADGTYREIPLNYKDMIAGKTPPPELQPEDIVYLPMSGWKATLIHGSQLIGEAAYSTVYATH